MNADGDHITPETLTESVAEAPTPEHPVKTQATILQVLPGMEQGGVERGTVEIAGAIVEAGGRALVASNGGRMVHDLTRVGAEHITLPLHSKNVFTMAKNVGRLQKLIQDEDVDLIHARSRAPAWSAFYAARRTGKPFITTFHGTYGHSNFLKRRYNAVMTKGDRVIAISKFIGGHVIQMYGTQVSKIRIIPRGVDVRSFHPDSVSAERMIQLANDWWLTDGAPVVMLPGRLTRWKGQTVFIEAIAKLARHDIRCLLVGSDQGRSSYRKEVEGLIAEHGLTPIVRIVDDCRDMPAAYKLADVVVSASTDPEAFGRVIVEAQALGRPVVAADHGGARETVIPGETGWLVPPGDSDALAEALGKVLNMDGDARKTLSEKAIQNVHRNFSKDAMCARTLAVYDEALNLTPGQ